MSVGYRGFMLDRIKNPVFAQELSRWYKRKFVVITTITYLLYLGYCTWILVGFGQGEYTIFHLYYAVYPVVAMIYLAVPPFGATSVVDERRSQTLMPVQLSLLRPFDIVWGKVVAPVVPNLVPAGISMLTWGLLLLQNGGGFWVSGAGAVFVFTWVMCSAFIVSTVSVLISTLSRSGAQAITLSYAVLVLVVLFWLLSLLGSYAFFNFFYDRYSLSTIINVISSNLGFTVWMAYYFTGVVASACIMGGSVWWACSRLRLPLKSSGWLSNG